MTAVQKIQTLSSGKERKSISRSKLAHDVAKKLKRYLDDMSVGSHPNETPHNDSQARDRE